MRGRIPRFALAMLCTAAIAAEDSSVKIPPAELDALVAPVALFPDPLLAQTLAASTYPLEIVQLQQWLAKNSSLKDQALADAVEKQPWDPSVQAMAALPDVVKRLADDIQWTTDLGNAFLAQQSEVMAAVQRMRSKAKDNGQLQSNEQLKVQTQANGSDSVIVIEQANPQIVYVPAYNPVVVYGPPVYPYPPIYYPPPYGAMAISFGVGVAMGAFWSGGWGWGCGWGSSNVIINVDNHFNRVSHHGGARGNRNWQHNPQHRGGTPYPNRATADRFGGATRGASTADRKAGSASTRDRATGGADHIGSRDVSRSGSSSPGAFGGDARGYNGGQARAASSRGAYSMGSRGGASRGGGRRG